ncbi:DUF551 domain-containing protein [Wielerella bovis]|uniref:DUF551 domain-containing protein n=1 Tax=Wielerella bovis TaxID=2917790 RepID=UPI002019C903|nr:DUF551 domain-containing protein [Wielerella bovis]ULJ66624.1 DUF551 domain-containing protein [Wielerella bovis]
MTEQEYEKERVLFEEVFRKVHKSTPNLEHELEHFRMPNDFFPVRYFKPKTHTAYQWWLIGRDEQRREYYLNQSAWISVADRLPEDDESFDGLLGSNRQFYIYAKFVTHWRVTKFYRSRNPETGEYAWTDRIMYKDSRLILNESLVSHWQPEIFPQPPKASE